MALVQKEVKYIGKDFGQLRANLINFAKTYFPDSYKDFNESSPGMMFIEMAAYVGDVLSFYTDQTFRETNLSTAQERGNIFALSQMFGHKPKLRSAATTTIEVFQLLPSIGTGAAALPDYRYALTINSGMRVSSDSGKTFRTLDPVDFNDTADADISTYSIDNSGNITYYLLKKTVSAVSGEVKTSTFTFGNPKQFDKIVLPTENFLDIINVTDSNNNRWHKVDYLAQDTVFEDIANISFNDPELSQYRSTVPYILKLRRTPRRYVTRVRADGKTEMQFGSGISSDADEEIIPNPKNVGLGLDLLSRTTSTNIDPSNFLYTSTYGLVPSDTTLTVTYTVGGDTSENVNSNSITAINAIEYLNDNSTIDLTSTKASVAISNPEPARGALASPNLENIRMEAAAAFAAQNRAVTREDYIVRAYSMPARYGSIDKVYIVGDSQLDTSDKDYPRDVVSNPLALNMYCLGYDSNNKLTILNKAIKENLRTYMSEHRLLTDAINIKNAYIINLGIDFEIVTRPNENSHTVILRCIERLKQIFSNDRMQINGTINTSNLVSELDQILGVQSVASVNITNLFDTEAGYSGNVYDIRTATKNNIIYPSLDPSIFEIKYPNNDIKGRVVKP
jgi:hypothetical protein